MPGPLRGRARHATASTPGSRGDATARAFLLAVFFASGFAALLYQTIWQRMLTLFGGADVYSITIIVSAFMAGLGFGSLTGGHVADRLSVRGCVRAFAACEFAVAVFALLSPAIYYDGLYVHAGALLLSRPALAAVIFGVTLWPTFFMGMSLPLVSRLVDGSVSHSARWIPALYGWNTVGAATGSLVAVTVLFPLFDFQMSVRLGAVISLCCGTAAMVLGPRLARNAPPETPPASSSTSREIAAASGGQFLSISAWLVVYALSGFIALSLEIVWFRVLGVVLKSNAGTFGFLLAVYLLGVGGGSLLARGRLFDRRDPTRAFFTLQALVPLWAAFSLSALVAAVDRIGWAQPLWTFMAGANPLGPAAFRSGRAVVLYGVLAFGLILPATTLMGMSFALLQRAVHDDPRLVGRRVGWLQTANIIGAMAGALVTGLYLLDWLGSAPTLRLLSCGALVFIALRAASQSRASRGSSAILAVGAVLVAAFVPDNARFWSRLHGASPDTTIAREAASGFVLLKEDAQTKRTRVFLAGISQSWLPYGSIHTALGALPVLMHPHPVHVAVIGLGSGDTAFAIAGRPETETIDSIEIVSAQHDALMQLALEHRYPALQILLDDPRVHHQFTDARAYLRRGGARYDLIEADALLPTSAYAGNLYSTEYFSLLRDSLGPGGFAVTWTPTERTRASVLQVFPYVLFFRSLAVGTLSPVAFDAAAVRARLDETFTKRHYADGGVDVAAAIAPFLAEGAVAYGPEFDRRTLVDVNRDLFPQDEFGRPAAHAGSLIDALAH